MRIGVPRESKNHEYRVGLDVESVAALTADGHDVWIETGAGAGIITDARDHWAYAWMIDVAQAGIMPADVNYRFQPERAVSRAEFARVLVRMLRAAGVEPAPPAALPSFSDLDPGHLDYPPASEVVAAGLLRPLPRNTFRPGLPVGGGEAAEALSRLARAAGTGQP